MYYKIFIDESGSKDYINPYSVEFIDNPPLFKDYPKFWQDNYFVLCAVRIKQENIDSINCDINTLKNRFFKTHSVEIKSDWLRNPFQRKKYYLVPYGINNEQLNDFGNQFIDIIAHYKHTLKLFAVVFDKRYYGDAKRQRDEGQPLLKATQVLFERFQYSSGYNFVVFDQMESSLKLSHGQHDHILNIFTKNKGMESIYVNEYNKIVDIKFKKSKQENFLQVADVCAYNIFRQFVEYGRDWSGTKKDKDGVSKMDGYPYFDRIRCNFAFHPFKPSQVRGVGLTCIPDSDKINWDILGGCFE